MESNLESTNPYKIFYKNVSSILFIKKKIDKL